MTEEPWGAVLRKHRQRLGLTQADLASRTGLSVRAVRDLEQDRVSQPRPRSLRALATALDLTGPALSPPVRTPSVAVLGTVEVRQGGTVRTPPCALPRRLLILLALHEGRGVGQSEIIHALWGDHPPASARNQVHTYIGGLRRLLEPGRPAGSCRVLTRTGDAYRLDPAHCRVDVAEFGDLLAQGLSARAPEQAERLLGQALTRWRGTIADPAIAGHPATVRLNERRTRAALAYADVARHGDIVDALRPLIVDEPLHEALHARMVRALGATGRQADALALYDSVRRRLADELGIDPGAELRTAHLDVLTQRGLPLTPASARGSGGPRHPAAPRRRGRRHGWG